ANWLVKDPISNFVENQAQCDPFVTYVPDDNFEQALIDLGYDNFLDDYVNTSAINTVTTLSIGNLGINDLTGIEDFIALEVLNCSFNNLSSLDVSNAPNLLQLFCFENNLTTLDVTNNPALQWLDCKNNNLNTLDISNNTVLERIDFQDNNLTTLNISWSTALQHVRLQNNQLQTLDVRSGANTNITIFDTTGNPTLSCIFVDNAAYSIANWPNIDATSTFVENQAQCNSLNVFVPDDNFEQALIDLGYDSGPLDDFVLKSSINTLTVLDVSSKNIFDFTGINQFVALEDLNVSLNPIILQIDQLNISNLTALRILNCSNTQLTSLDVSNNTALTNLKCNNNQLTNLDVTQNTALTQLWTHNNQLSNLDVSQNTVLSQLYCSTNSLTTLDVSQNTVLAELRCQVNMLTSLNVSQNTSLVELWCRDNQITNLDLSLNTNLAELIANNNNLTSLNIKNGNNTAITNANFNATNNPNLTCINVDDDAYSSTNWTNIDAQSGFSTDCSATTYVPDDNFEQALIDLGYDSGALDNFVLTFNISSITSLDISNKNIADVTGIEDFTSLVFFDCYTNQISNLDVSNSPALVQLKCGTNQLTSLDVSSNTNLTILNCFNNQLTSLDVKNGNNTNFTFFKADNNLNLTCINVDDAAYSTTNWTNIDAQTHFSTSCGAETYVPDDNFEQALIDLGYDTVLNDYVPTANINTITALNVVGKIISDLTGIEDFVALEDLYCGSNLLTSLDISNNTALKILHCFGNLLTSLDVSSNTQLESLNGNSNQLSSLDVSNNTNLILLLLNNNNLTNLDLSNNLSLINLTCNINQLTNLDVTLNTDLMVLRCDNNQLTSLDLSQNTALTNLRCENNQLTSLNVKNGNNTNVTTFIATNNPNLTCIEVDNAAYSTANWTNIDAQTSFSENCSTAILLSAKVYLQGAATNPNSGEGTWMRDDLRVSGSIPTTSPYTDALTVNASVFNPTGSDAIVDWVFVELRDQANSATVLASQSALLQRDGDVVSVDGVSPLPFNMASGNYFVAVSHRNHIGVISASAIGLSASTTLVDFSASSAAAQGGTNALLNLGNGIYAIYTGDFDGNAQIQNTDATAVIALLGGSGYTAADMDVNGQIQNTDVNNFINPNIGKGQQFAKIAGGGSKTYSANAAHNITFSFANAQNTNDGSNDFYEVDILIESDQDFKLGSGQLYFNYNTAAFGTNISANSKIEYTQPTGYILGEFNVLDVYGQFVQNDNTTSRVSLSWQQALSSGAMVANNVTATPALLFHIKIQYIDVAQSPTVCFEQDPLFLDQTFTACGPTTFATVDCTNNPGTQLLNDSFDCNGATLGLTRQTLQLDIKLYPNPTQNTFSVKGLKEDSQLEIYNLNGVLVLNLNNYKGKRVDVSSLSASVYFVKISNGNTTRVKRLIVE
ncbi:Internalin-like protein (LPXTG motif) Lmo0331 homolog, partial [hydrothermal vent metagenome]